MPEVKLDAADVITAAATSPLGILALICLIVAFLAHSFFAKAKEATRVKMFLIIIGVIIAGVAIWIAANRQPAASVSQRATNQTPNPTPTDAMSLVASRLPVAQKIPSDLGLLSGKLVINRINETALGFRISSYFIPDSFDYRTKKLKDSSYDMTMLPLAEVKRIHLSWACRQKELRSLMSDGGEGEYTVSAFGFSTSFGDKLECEETS